MNQGNGKRASSDRAGPEPGQDGDAQLCPLAKDTIKTIELTGEEDLYDRFA